VSAFRLHVAIQYIYVSVISLAFEVKGLTQIRAGIIDCIRKKITN